MYGYTIMMDLKVLNCFCCISIIILKATIWIGTMISIEYLEYILEKSKKSQKVNTPFRLVLPLTPVIDIFLCREPCVLKHSLHRGHLSEEV